RPRRQSRHGLFGRRRRVGALVGSPTTPRGPERLDLGKDPLAELVTGAGQRKGRVGVQAFQPAGPGLSADPARELRAEAALLFVRGLDACAQLGILPREPAPTLDPTHRLEPRDRLDEVRAGQVVAGREGLTRIVERLLLGDRGATVGAADDYPPQRPRRAAELAFDDRAVIHPARS